MLGLENYVIKTVDDKSIGKMREVLENDLWALWERK